jgi:hypothetical protein
MQSLSFKERSLHISGKITISAYRAGMVEKVTPYLEQIQWCKSLLTTQCTEVFNKAGRDRIERVAKQIEEIKAAYFMRTAVECPNLIMDSPGYGLDLIIQRLVGMNTYSLNILYGEIGIGATAPALTDTALTAPTNRAAVGFQQDYGTTDAIFQFFFSDSQLANQTYNEFGTFVDGAATIGTGQIFNHSLLTPAYAKSGGTDTSVEVDINVSNS